MTEPPKPTIKPKRSAWQIVGILLILFLVLSLIGGGVGVSAYNDSNPVVERQTYDYGGYQNSKKSLRQIPLTEFSRPGNFRFNLGEQREEVDARIVARVKRYFKELNSDLPRLKASREPLRTQMVPVMRDRSKELLPPRYLNFEDVSDERELAATAQSLDRQLQIWRTWNWKELEIGHVIRIMTYSGRNLEVFVAFPKPDGTRIKIRFTLYTESETNTFITAWDNLATGEESDADVALSLIAASNNSGRDRLLLNLRSLPEAHRQMDAKKFVEARKQLDIAARAQPTGPLQVGYELAEARYDNEYAADSDVEDYRRNVDRLEDVLNRDPLNLPALMLQMQKFVYFDRYEEVEKLARRYQSIAGPDADAIAWAGAAQVGLKQTEEARILFRDALKLDPYQAEAIFGLLKLTPVDEKQAFVDGIAKLKYFRELFHRLVDDRGWYDDWQSLEFLARAHGQRFPDDLSGVRHLVQALIMREQFAAATKLFQSALPKLTGEPRGKLLDQFLNISAMKQRHRAAYDAVPNEDRPKAFQKAMGAWDNRLIYHDDEFEDEVEPLEATSAKFNSLLAIHEKSHPNDVWLSIYRAKQQGRDNDPTAAEKNSRAVLDRLKPTGDATQDYQSGFFDARREWLLAKVQLGQTVAAYDRFPDGTTFDELAGACVSKSNSSELKKLLTSRDKADGKPLVLLYWRGELHWLKKEYTECTVQMKSYLDQPPELGQSNDHSYQARDRLIRSWVKMKNSEATALRFLEEQEYPLPILKALVLASGNNTEEAETFLLKEMTQSPWIANQVYSDADLGPLLKGMAFDRLREKFPPPKKYGSR